MLDSMECIGAMWVNIAVMLASIEEKLDLFAALEMPDYILAKLVSNLDSERTRSEVMMGNRLEMMGNILDSMENTMDFSVNIQDLLDNRMGLLVNTTD